MDNRSNTANNYNNFNNRRQGGYGGQQSYQNNYTNNRGNGYSQRENYNGGGYNNQNTPVVLPAQSQLKNISFDLSEIYFPIFVLQMRFDIFPLRNRSLRQNYQGQSDQIQEQSSGNALTGYEDIMDDDYDLYQEYQRQYYEGSIKVFFILRDQFLLTKIQITVDDSTGVMTCVLWLNDNSNQPGQFWRKNADFRSWFAEKQVQIGSVLSILGTMEYYKDKLQVNARELRAITDINEEMLQYQQTINAQKCFFDPFKPFQRRLFNANWQQEQQQQQQQQQQEGSDSTPIDQSDNNVTTTKDEVYTFSIKRIKKKINDYILNHYNELFVVKSSSAANNGRQTDVALQDTEGNSPSPVQQQSSIIPLDYQQLQVTEQDILKNPQLLAYVTNELQFSEDPSKDPTTLLRECLVELEEKGFINLVGETVRQYLFLIREQRKKLKYFIQNEMKSATSNQRARGGSGGMHFETIYKEVCKQYDNFYTKEFVFKVIDELFQMGVIYEVGKCQYAYLDNQFGQN